MALHSVLGYVLRGGGVRPVTAVLTALLALGALLAGSLVALAPVQADGHLQPELVLTVPDESDNVVPPDSEISINAQLRFRGSLDGEAYNLSNTALRLRGDYFWQWESSSRLRLAPADSDTGPAEDPTAGRTSLELLSPTRADGSAVGATGLVVAAALHSRTLLATSVLGEAYLFDTWNRRQAAVISAPDTVDSTSTFGRTDSSLSDNPVASGAAVWQESENTAWLFIASPDDDIGGAANVGSVYIYKVDWSASPVEVTMVKRLVPPRSEFGNVKNTSGSADEPRYGSSIVISGDGSTLAVGAQRMNHIGAVYVYTRPDAAGQSWGDIEYADGTKVTTAPTPPWGDPSDASTRPFNHTDANNCDWWCRDAAMMFEGGPFQFAFPDLAISRDGRVLAVAAPLSCHVNPNRTVAEGIGCTGGIYVNGIFALQDVRNQGLVYVFVAPEGGWAAAPLARAGAGGATKTLIAAGANANGFNPANHYAPGPARRVVAETGQLRGEFGYTANQYFGQALAVSSDGLAIAASSHRQDGRVQMFQVSSVSGWSVSQTRGSRWGFDVVAGGLGRGGLAFNRDDSQMLIGYAVAAPNNSGDVHFWNRQTDGRYVDGGGFPTIDPGLEPPTDANQGYFGVRPRWDPDGARYVISRPVASQTGAAASGFFLGEGHACAPATVGGEPGVECLIASGSVVIPAGTKGQTLTVNGELTMAAEGDAGSAVTVRAEPLEITIDEVVEVAELKMDRATNDQGTTNTDDDTLYPDTLQRGETTRLHLQVLNENGAAAGTGSVGVLNITTTVGELSTTIGEGCQGGNGGASCVIDGSSLTARNSDKVFVTLRYPRDADIARASTASVNATAISKAGETANAGPLSIALAGPATSLAISEPSTSLLGVDTADTGAAIDNRDVLTLAVTAADENGSDVPTPTSGSQTAWMTGPDGKRVQTGAGGVELSWPLLDSADEPLLNAAGQRQVRIDVDRAAAQPLTNGEYTLSVRAGTLTAERTFTVAGAAASISLEPETVQVDPDGEFTVTATLSDAAGASVPDGTPVEWSEIAPSGSAGVVQLRRDLSTTDGQASATYTAVTPGMVTLTAAADGLTAVTLVRVAAPPPPSLAESLTATSAGAFAIWTSAESIRASDLLPALEGVTTLSIWHNGRWLRYGVVAGQLVHGSRDFTIARGDALWLSADPPG